MNKITLTFRYTLHTLLIALLLLVATPLYAFSDLNKQQPIAIQDLVGKGRWTVFEIWDSSCLICRDTIHEITRFSTSFPNADVYGISTDGTMGRSDALAFVREHHLQFPHILTHFVEMSDFLLTHAGERLIGTPTLMLYTPEGQLLAVQPGPVTAKELIAFIQNEERLRAAQ